MIAFKNGSVRIMIEINNVCKFYGRPVLKNFSCTFNEGASTAVLGPSGCGKTTVINMLLGLVKPDCGTVEVKNVKKMSAVFQEDRLIETLTLKQNACVAANRRNIDEILKIFEIYESRNKYPFQSSGGMRRRAAIARAVLRDADLYVFDEPFKGIEPALKNNIIESINVILNNKTRILVTHDIREAVKFAEYVKIIENGGKIVFDNRADIIDDEFIKNYENGINLNSSTEGN